METLVECVTAREAIFSDEIGVERSVKITMMIGSYCLRIPKNQRERRRWK